MSMREALITAIRKDPNSEVARMSHDRFTEEGLPYVMLTDGGFLPSRLRRIVCTPRPYATRPDRAVISARSTMQRYWGDGGRWLVDRFKDPERNAALQELTDWSQDSHELTIPILRKALDLRDTNCVYRAIKGLNIGNTLDSTPDLYQFSTEELLQLMVGALAIRKALVTKGLSGRKNS